MKNSKRFKSDQPRPPKGLSREASAWWRTIVSSFNLEDASLLVLQGAMECLDRMRQAQEAIRSQGLTITDRFGQPKQNPNLLTERDAKQGLLRHLKALNLDLEPLNEHPGRPSGAAWGGRDAD